MNADLIESRKSKKVDFIKIFFQKDYLSIELRKIISVKKKKLKRKDGYYVISYGYNSKLFDGIITHKVEINRLYENVISKYERKKIQAKKVKPVQEPTKPPPLKPSSNEVKIWTARDTSYRRCEHCHYYSYRQKMCGLFTKRVEENNACIRFYAPKFRTYSGGRFSPR
ncbi:hypothetical protein BKP45_07605 [Anaerobacillus alkalidiazotrophicus]|uniref:Uncharacterized protein n=1 Tax=Anaerobacillus alkalidiazotrophicus TaxID=472963 RepID=A0A1S2MAV4_9BACI|nr:hypothetical protein [Anaerobacillus alkalidiazotrophicus]OIJ20957.1 hypothetical protein BKP45_07605 [Anaerobacillus alkalidiazotrophicus]